MKLAGGGSVTIFERPLINKKLKSAKMCKVLGNRRGSSQPKKFKPDSEVQVSQRFSSQLKTSLGGTELPSPYVGKVCGPKAAQFPIQVLRCLFSPTFVCNL